MNPLSSTIAYDPAPIAWLGGGLEGAGQFRLRAPEGLAFAETERRTIAAVRALARDADAAARRREVRTLVVHTSQRFSAGFDVRWLTGFDALERLVVMTNAGGIRGAHALAHLPSLREATLYAHGDNRIEDVDGIAASRSIEVLRFWWGGLRDLRALRGMSALRSLSLHENEPFSLRGIESSGIGHIDLWLPGAECDLSAIAALPSLRTLRLRGVRSRESLRTLAARSPTRLDRVELSASGPDGAVLDALAALPPADEVHVELSSLLGPGASIASLPVSHLRVAAIDASGLRRLSRAPRLNTLRIGVLHAPDLEPIADLPSLRVLSLRRMPGVRSVDRLPACAFEPPDRAPPGPARLVFAGTAVESLDALHRIRGVSHLDLRYCRALRSIAGLRSMPDVRSIDLRGVPRGVDFASLAEIPTLRAVMLNHRDPADDAFPASVRSLIRRAHLRGLVARGVE